MKIEKQPNGKYTITGIDPKNVEPQEDETLTITDVELPQQQAAAQPSGGWQLPSQVSSTGSGTQAAPTGQDKFPDATSAKQEADARTSQAKGQPTFGYKKTGPTEYTVYATTAIGVGPLEYTSPWTFETGGDDRDRQNLEENERNADALKRAGRG